MTDSAEGEGKCESCGKHHQAMVGLNGKLYCLPCFKIECEKVGSAVRKGFASILPGKERTG